MPTGYWPLSSRELEISSVVLSCRAIRYLPLNSGEDSRTERACGFRNTVAVSGTDYTGVSDFDITIVGGSGVVRGRLR